MGYQSIGIINPGKVGGGGSLPYGPIKVSSYGQAANPTPPPNVAVKAPSPGKTPTQNFGDMMGSFFGSLPGAAVNYGRGIFDTAKGMVTGPVEAVNSMAGAGAAVINHAMGGDKAVANSYNQLHQTNNTLIAKGNAALKDPNTPAATRTMWQAALPKIQAHDQAAYQEQSNQTGKDLQMSDPIKYLANGAQVLLTALTAGEGGAAIKGGEKVLQGTRGALTPVEQGIKKVVPALKGAAIGGSFGALSPIGQKGGQANVADIATGATAGAIGGGLLGGLSSRLGELFRGGPKSTALDDYRNSLLNAQGQHLLSAGDTTPTPTLAEGQTPKLLGRGPITNESTSVIKGKAATPASIPLSEEEFSQKLQAINADYQAKLAAHETQVKTASKNAADVAKQQVAMKQIDDTHEAALNDLHNAYDQSHQTPLPNSPGAKLTPDERDMLDTAKSYKSADDYITASAKSYLENEKGAFVGKIDKSGPNEPYGSHVERISEHSQFYSDYYKAHGHAPSLKATKEAIESDMQNGKATPGLTFPGEDKLYQVLKAKEAQGPPMSEDEFNQRFQQLSDSYDKQTKAASKIAAPLKQKIILDQIHEDHLHALNELLLEQKNGKTNPAYDAGTPDMYVPSGFVMGENKTALTPEKAAGVPAYDSEQQQLHTRISQIDKIMGSAAKNGTTRSAEELRALAREKQDARDVLSGKQDIGTVYPNKSMALEASKPTSTLVAEMPWDGKTGNPSTPAEAPKQTNPDLTDQSLFKQLPKVGLNNRSQSGANRDYVANGYQDLKNATNQAAKGMSEHDLNLLRETEVNKSATADEAKAKVQAVANKADNPKQFMQVLQAMRKGFNARFGGDQTLGRDVGYIHNYLPQQWNFDNPDVKAGFDALNAPQNQAIVSKSLPGYTHERQFETGAQAEDFFKTHGFDPTTNEWKVKTGGPEDQGLITPTRANPNALKDFNVAMDRASAEHGSQALLKGLNEAHPGKVSVGKIGYNPESGDTYKGLNIPGGKNFALPSDLADQYNTQVKSDPNKLMGLYDKYVNRPLKTGVLAGGLFHGGNTAYSAAPLLSLGDNVKLATGTLKEGNFNKQMADIATHDDGTGMNAHEKLIIGGSKPTRNANIDAEMSAMDKVGKSKLNFLTAPYKATFDRQIPLAKAMVMDKLGAGLDPKNPGDLAKIQQISRSVDEIFGGATGRTDSKISPNTIRTLGRFVLAPDYQYGRIMTAARAANVFQNDVSASMARRTIIGRTLIAALPGVISLAASGKLNPNDPLGMAKLIGSQLVNPSVPLPFKGAPNATNPGGTPQEAKLPGTVVTDLSRILGPMFDNMSPDKLSGLESYGAARLAAPLSIGKTLATNKDFYGNPVVVATDPVTNNVDVGKTALNVASQFAPIPVAQGAKVASGQEPLASGVLNTAGFRVGNNPNTQEAAHSQRTTDYKNTLYGITDQRAKVVKQMDLLLQQNKINQAARLGHQFNLSIPSKVAPLRSKYSGNWNPLWDQNFASARIPITTRSFNSRIIGSKLKAAALK